jgi:hypothetical protein
VSVLEQTAKHGREWLQQAHAADERASKLGGTQVALDYAADATTRNIEFRGYEYTRTQSEISGALMTRYDESKPQVWTVPLRDKVVPGTTVTAPMGGYLVPAAQASSVVPLLRAHGIAFSTLSRPVTRLASERFRSDSAELASTSVEGHQRLTVSGKWVEERIDIVAGALFIPVAQPRARIVIALLEPQAPDSLAAWGEFNNFFEQKEYMEAYVAEEVARNMLANDAALRGEFEKRLAEDPKFAASPQARLDFFHRRHSSWDMQFQRYPILRVAEAPASH